MKTFFLAFTCAGIGFIWGVAALAGSIIMEPDWFGSILRTLHVCL